jgi:folate-dependent phosphoribosylglycinamide formyltransferase PurN
VSASSGRRLTAEVIEAGLRAHGIHVHHVSALDTGHFVILLDQTTGQIDEAVALLRRKTTGVTVRRVAPAVIRLDPAR